MSKRHALGQHFLISNEIADSIADLAGIKKSDTVLEVGTGRGILTPRLCSRAGKVISVEKDGQLYAKAGRMFSGINNLALVHGDAFGMDLDFTVLVSNLPYSESRNAIEWLVQRGFSHGIVMVQKEFAQKLLAKGTKRRAVSVVAGYCLEIEELFDVKRSNFRPAPKVDSVVIRLRLKQKIPKGLVVAVNKLFSFKRKKIRNIARQLGLVIDSDKRLEDLSEGEIFEIAKKIA